MKNIFAKCFLVTALCLLLSACIIRPYKFDLKQGNVITREKVEQIHEGMSSSAVRYALGTPMLNDVFHTDRWDYIYIDKPNKGKETRRHVAIYFDDGRVTRIQHGALPE